MREQLSQYVELLFAGNAGVEDIKEEILQNTLDRYDDLIAQGKTPQDAYRLSITGIGDVNEIINGKSEPVYSDVNQSAAYAPMPEFDNTAMVVSRLMRAIAIFLYIISPVPLFLFSRLGWDEVGLCCLLIIVGIATALLLLFKSPKSKEAAPEYADYTDRPRTGNSHRELKKSVGKLVSTIGVVLYFIISFSTGAWFITWLIFPIIGAVKGVVNSCIDMREDY